MTSQQNNDTNTNILNTNLAKYIEDTIHYLT